MSAVRATVHQLSATPEGVFPGSPTPHELVRHLLDDFEDRLVAITGEGYSIDESLLAAAAWVVARRCPPHGNLDVSYIPKVIDLYEQRLRGNLRSLRGE